MSFTGRSEAFSATVLTNNGFMPDITLGEFQEQYRIATEFSQGMVQQALLLAMLEVNGRLAKKQVIWQQAGAEALANVPEQPLQDGYVNLYKAAVMHWAKGELIHRYKTVHHRKNMDEDDASMTEDWYRQRADQYVRQLTGHAGVTCELV